MNSSNSPLVNIAEPASATPSSSPGSAAPRPAAEGGDFDAVYSSERDTLKASSKDKSLNNNDLKDGNQSGEATSREASSSSEGEDQNAVADAGGVEQRSRNDEDTARAVALDRPQPSPETLADDEQTGAIVHTVGIVATAAAADDAPAGGELLPSSGKNLPPPVAAPSRQAQYADGVRDAALKQLTDEPTQALAREADSAAADNKPTGLGLERVGMGRVGNSLSGPEAIAKLNSGEPDYFRMEAAMNSAPIKITTESILEGLAALGVKPSTESISATSLNSPVAATAFAVTTPDFPSAATPAAGGVGAEQLDPSLNLRGNSTDWSQAIGDKIRWMRNAGAATAELHLNPAELGSIEIKIVTEDQQARVSFIASSPVAQEMIEESLSKLKELLADHGIALDQSETGPGEDQNQFAQDDRKPGSGESALEPQFENEALLASNSRTVSRIGQVDHYV